MHTRCVVRALSFAVVPLALLSSCELVFHLQELTSACQLIEEASLAEPTDGSEVLVLETPGVIAVFHGFACAESSRDGREDVLKVAHTLPLPDYARDATVFLNGWSFEYADDDHHVAGLGTLVRDIRIEGRSLRWEVIGALGDHNFDDSYSWCYRYTVIAWNPSRLALVVDDDDRPCDPDSDLDPTDDNFFLADNERATTALASFPSFLVNPGFESGRSVAVLPRGFSVNVAGNDHHLLQLAYGLGHSEAFVEGDKAYRKGLGESTPLPAPSASLVSRNGSGFVSWETSAILKDNDGRRDFRLGEMVSGVGGPDVGLIQPPFAVLPREDGGFFSASLGSAATVRTREYVVENVPFELAIPVLSGWELAYGGDDEHVTELGIGIDEWRYEKDPAAAVGTLRYTLTSVLRDKDGSPGHFSQHKVTVLGLLPSSPGGVPSKRTPDLVPFSPLGSDAAAFCRLEEQSKLLRVTVRNQGDADAGPSRTTVAFGSTSTPMNTPPIPAGGSVDLLFKVPADCFVPDCAFRILVDSAHQVDEGDQEGNNAASGTCTG